MVADDTDVLVLLIHYYHKWKLNNSEIWMLSQESYLPIHSIAKFFGSKCKQLIGLNTLTGCDTVSHIFGVSKSKGLKVMISNRHSCLEELGHEREIAATSFTDLFYGFYGHDNYTGTLSQQIYKLIAEKGATGCQLPPTESVLTNHIKSAKLQAFVWLQADLPEMYTPNYTQHGWKFVNNTLIPDYNVSKISTNLTSCKCRGDCCNLRCSCKNKGQRCSDICMCVACSNT